MDTKIKENRPEELKKPSLVNTFRTSFDVDKIILELGNIDDKTIDVVSNVYFDPKMLYAILVSLVQEGMSYEEKYKIKIFPENAIEKNENTGE